jgi:hypothetical protein
VTSIGDQAFSDCPSLAAITVDGLNPVFSSVAGVLFDKSQTTLILYPIGNPAESYTVPSSVTSVGVSAFSGCTSLTNIAIPNSVTHIGAGAFSLCSSLSNVTIPNSVTYIGVVAFSSCASLSSVTIPNSVASIGDDAFEDCASLTNVAIGSGLSSIGAGVFSGCTNLAAITVDGLNPVFTSVAGVLFDKSQTALIQYPTGNAAESYTVPSSVTSVGVSAFSGCASLTNVTIPNSVTSIGGYAFSYCTRLTSVTIPNSVTSIGDYAFSDCIRLTSVTIGNGVATIGYDAFANCSKLASLTIPNSVTSIGGEAFLNCDSLSSVTIPNSVTSIGQDAFNNCSSLTTLTIGSGVTNIAIGAFGNCFSLGAITVDQLNPVFSSVAGGLFDKSQTTLIQYPIGAAASSYTIPSSVTSIGVQAFFDCRTLTSVTIPNSVTNIGDIAFEDCGSLTNVTIGSGVTSIGNGAFGFCSLTSVTIPNSVTSIGDQAFYYCACLNSIYFQGNVPSFVGLLIFQYDPVTVYCYAGTKGWGTTFAGAPCIVIDTAPPVITVQPTNALVSAHGSTTLTVAATGTNLFYQWLLDDSNILNATNSSLIVSGITQSDLGAYQVVVANAYGSSTSAVATLTMPPFLATGFDGLVTCWGLTNTLSVVAWGSGQLSYQWFDNGIGIQDATNQTLTLTSIQFTNSGLYSVVVSSPLGSVTNTPAPVVVCPAGVALGMYPGMHPGVTVSGVVGYTYLIQSNPDLADINAWTTVATMTLTNPAQLWEDINVNTALPANAQRFYRVLPGP